MVAVHPGMITPQVVAKMGVKPRPDQRRPLLDQHRQRLVARRSSTCSATARGSAMPSAIRAWANSSEVIKGLWTDSDFNFEGKFYRAHVRAALTGAEGKVVIPDAGDIVARPAAALSRRSMPQAARRTAKAVVARALRLSGSPSTSPAIAISKRTSSAWPRISVTWTQRAATFGRKLRYAINPQVIVCERRTRPRRLRTSRAKARLTRATAW